MEQKLRVTKLWAFRHTERCALYYQMEGVLLVSLEFKWAVWFTPFPKHKLWFFIAYAVCYFKHVEEMRFQLQTFAPVNLFLFASKGCGAGCFTLLLWFSCIAKICLERSKINK